MILYCATSNRAKLREFSQAAPVLAVPGIEETPLCPETGSTFEENATLKALHYGRLAAGWVFADDSGLEVDALGGAPGIYSARFAGPLATDQANNRLLIEKMRGADRRTARFVCAIALAKDGEIAGVFRGEVEGQILHEPRGAGGFGYDPLFFYPPLDSTFAELDSDKKWQVSHRGRAMQEMIRFIGRK